MKKMLFYFLTLLVFSSACGTLKKTQEDTSTALEQNQLDIAPDNSKGVKEEVAVADESNGSQLANFYVIVGSFKEKGNAQVLNNSLKELGFNAVILMNKANFYRVSLGGHNDEEIARRELAYVKKSFDRFTDAWLLIAEK